MASLEIELNDAGIQELLKSAGVLYELQSQADRIKNRCGDDYATSTHIGRNRANVSVYATTKEAKQDNLENNTLLKAIS